ncbi:MAG: GAF domain-containing protein [Dehalococcoidia bacterium]
MEEQERKYYLSLYEVAASVNSARSPENVLDTLVETVVKAMNVKGCSLILLTPDRKGLIHTASYGLSDRYIQKGPVSVDKSISEALEGKPVVILDATEDDRIQYRLQAEKEGIVSILSVPMMLKEEIIGVVRLYTAKQRHFTADDIYFVQAVANLSAIALENARLYESIQEDRDELIRDLLESRAARYMLN